VLQHLAPKPNQKVVFVYEKKLNRLGHEKNMEEEFGQEYFKYRRRTGMFLPVLNK